MRRERRESARCPFGSDLSFDEERRGEEGDATHFSSQAASLDCRAFHSTAPNDRMYARCTRTVRVGCESLAERRLRRMTVR